MWGSWHHFVRPQFPVYTCEHLLAGGATGSCGETSFFSVGYDPDVNSHGPRGGLTNLIACSYIVAYVAHPQYFCLYVWETLIFGWVHSSITSSVNPSFISRLSAVGYTNLSTVPIWKLWKSLTQFWVVRVQHNRLVRAKHLLLEL